MMYFTPKQLAELLQLSRETIYNMVAAGQIKALRVGRNVRIPESELKRLEDGGAA